MPSDTPRTEPTLRLATIDDLDSIVTVHIASREAAYRGHLPDDAMDHQSVEERRSRWVGWLTAGEAQGQTLVAEIAGSIAGFCRFGPEASDPAGRFREIQRLYVAPDAQGHGLGRALLERATAMIATSGCTRAMLDVFDFNADAIRFYEHLGWVRFGVTVTPGPPDRSDGSITRYLYEKDLVPVSNKS